MHNGTVLSISNMKHWPQRILLKPEISERDKNSFY